MDGKHLIWYVFAWDGQRVLTPQHDWTKKKEKTPWAVETKRTPKKVVVGPKYRCE